MVLWPSQQQGTDVLDGITSTPAQVRGHLQSPSGIYTWPTPMKPISDVPLSQMLILSFFWRHSFVQASELWSWSSTFTGCQSIYHSQDLTHNYSKIQLLPITYSKKPFWLLLQSVFQCAFQYIPSPNIDWISSMLLLHCIQPSPGQRSPLESIMQDLYLALSFSTYYEAYIWCSFFQTLVLSFMLMTFFFKPVNSEAEDLQLQQDVNQIISWIQSRHLTPRCNSCQLAQRNLFRSTALFPRDSKVSGSRKLQTISLSPTHPL